MSQNAYIRAAGDSDYNFGHADFTVEFFMETANANSSPCQTLFEVTNNVSAAADLYQQTRFLTLLQNGNLHAVGLQTIAPFFIDGNVTTFSSPFPLTNNYLIFYDGKLLQNNQYTVDGMNITLSNVSLGSGNVLTEISEILFQVTGNAITSGSMHFISAERYQNQFYLYLDGSLQEKAVPAYYAIPTQYLPLSSNAFSNINRSGNAALLTIGANRNGEDFFFGKFGDFRVTNGVSRYAASFGQTDIIAGGMLSDSLLGTRSADINIEGGSFVDSISSYSPEEQVPAQIFDTLNISVYQSDLANANANIIGFGIFKSSIMLGAISSINIALTNSVIDRFAVPWRSVGRADASLNINGNLQPADGWSIDNGYLTINYNLPSSGYIDVTATGPTGYYCIAANGVSQLSEAVYANSTSITVANLAGFITPTLGIYSNISGNANSVINSRGQIFIGGECITYLYVDNYNNSLSGLVRGCAGTAVSNFYAANTQVISASYAQDISLLTGIDPGKSVWYSANSNIFATTSSLENTNSVISSLLLTYGTTPPEA